MASFTTLTDATLSTDKPVTQSVIRALRDNPLAIAEGGVSGAPKVARNALNQCYVSAYWATTGAPLGPSGYLPLNNTVVVTTDAFEVVSSVGRFKPQIDGVYHFTAYVNFASTDTSQLNAAISIYKNGSEIAKGQTTVPANTGGGNPYGKESVCIDIMDEATVGDYYELYYSSGLSGGSPVVSGSINNRFNARLVDQ